MTEEVRFFRRLSLYALIIGVIYWFVSYEWAGTTLLIVFGVGAGATTLFLRSGARARLDAGAAGPTPGTPAAAAMPGAPSGVWKPGAATAGPVAGAREHAPTPGAADAASTAPDGPFGDESGRIPSPTLSPFLVALAVALAALGLVFGPWFLLVAIVPLAMGAHGWFGSARAELDAVEQEPVADGR